MPALANHRRELFTQLLFQGFPAVDAYEKAGYKRHDGNASVLARHPGVQARLEEIRGVPVGTRAIAARANVTPETLMDELEQARALAMESKQPSAAVGATKEKSILSGHRIERAEIGGPGEFDHLSDDELLAAIRNHWARLDSETQLAIGNGSITLDGAPRNPKDRDH
jgi:hypothetical protein